ncbi:hypothetical protein HOY80DRAFT_446927 [Tuber brumale]|nr:hypothetical protein HOY80DRAFT_446927 [Tuber brumale]
MHSIMGVRINRSRHAEKGNIYLTAFLCRDLPAFREYSTVRVSSTTAYQYHMPVNKTVQLRPSADIGKRRAWTTLTIFDLSFSIPSDIQGPCMYQVPAIGKFLRVNNPVDLPSIDHNLEIAQRLVNTHRCTVLWMALVHYMKELFCMAAINCDEQEIINKPEQYTRWGRRKREFFTLKVSVKKITENGGKNRTLWDTRLLTEELFSDLNFFFEKRWDQHQPSENAGIVGQRMGRTLIILTRTCSSSNPIN